MAKLTETACRRAGKGRHSDGRGLILNVRESGSKTWLLRYKREGKDTAATLGQWPDMSLEDARAAAEAARAQRREGIDPVLGKARRVPVKTPTFEDAAQRYMATRTGWSQGYRARFENRMNNDVFPELGWTPVDKINARDVVLAVGGIKRRGALHTAKRVVNMIGFVMRYAVVMGWAENDPTNGLAAALGDSPPVQHRPAVTTVGGVQDLWARMDGYTPDSPALRLLQLLLLTAQRSGDVRAMRWEDIHDGAWRFTIGKTKVPHTVPLSAAAQAVLARCPQDGPYVIGGNRIVSDALPARMLDRLGYEKGIWTAHGFRAAFRTLAAEELAARDEVLAAHLGHVPASAHGRAYNRARFVAERTALMEQWAALVMQRDSDSAA